MTFDFLSRQPVTFAIGEVLGDTLIDLADGPLGPIIADLPVSGIDLDAVAGIVELFGIADRPVVDFLSLEGPVGAFVEELIAEVTLGEALSTARDVSAVIEDIAAIVPLLPAIAEDLADGPLADLLGEDGLAPLLDVLAGFDGGGFLGADGAFLDLFADLFLEGDITIGTLRGEVIRLGDEPDLVLGLPGADLIRAGDGDNDVLTGLGDDTFVGGADSDYVNGGFGDDRLVGRGGEDILVGLFGDDTIVGQGGDDRLFGFGGRDVIRGGGGDDVADAGAGADRVLGKNGDDVLVGGGGSDTVVGGAGSDVMTGGRGADLFLVRGREAAAGDVDIVADFAIGIDRVVVRGDQAIAEVVETADAPTQIIYDNGYVLAFAGLSRDEVLAIVDDGTVGVI